MKTIDELCTELKLGGDQRAILEDYVNNLVLELLESIKQDNIQNFDETINTINPPTK